MNQFRDNKSLSDSGRIVKNTLLSTLSELSLIFNSLFFILAVNYLGEEGYGKLASSLAFVGLFTLLIVFGFTYSITKFIVKQRDRAGEYVGNALYIQLASAALCFLLCYGFAWIFREQYPLEVRLLIVVVFAAETLKCLNLMLRTAHKALLDFRFATLAVLVERALLLGVGTVLLITVRDVFVIAYLMMAVRFLSFLILLFCLRPLKVQIRLRPDLTTIRTLIRQSWVYVVQHVFGRVYDHVDVVMLSLMSTFQQVTWYSAARRILEGLWLVPNIITEAVYPELNARHLVSHEQVQKLFDRTLKYMLVIGILVSMGTVIIARTLVGLIYPQEVEPAALVLILLGLAVVPSFLRYLFGTTLIAMNHQRIVNVVAASKSGMNIILNVVGILLYQYKGATIATVITEYVTLAAYCGILYKKGLLHAYQIPSAAKPLAAAAGLMVLYFLFPIHPLSAFFLFIFAYTGVMFLVGVFDMEEIALLKEHVLGRFLPGLRKRK